jgi:proteic killer suppression protein
LEIQFSNQKSRKQCTISSVAQKAFGEIVAEKLMMAIEFMESAENLKDIQVMPQYNLHLLKGKRKDQYAMDLGRRLGFRIILVPLDKNGKHVKNSDESKLMVESVNVKIEEVGMHYE